MLVSFEYKLFFKAFHVFSMIETKFHDVLMMATLMGVR